MTPVVRPKEKFSQRKKIKCLIVYLINALPGLERYIGLMDIWMNSRLYGRKKVDWEKI